jgi:DNA-binding SARP family transcriptional activator/TolB-like protein
MNSTSAFRLGLFGNRSLVGPEGSSLTGQAVQRHRIALLALLALSSDKGLSREKLMAYLWPERETENARQLLNQAVYTLRKALGDDAILSDGDDLRLNPDVIRTDLAEFEAALERRDYATAAQLYSGPFLDGFSIGDAPEFEWWVDRERQRLTATHAQAVEALAETASRNRDLPRAVELWKARAAQDPYDSRVTCRLMEALAASGNPAGALQLARVHQKLLETELGAAPSPEVLTLAERLRSPAFANEVGQVVVADEPDVEARPDLSALHEPSPSFPVTWPTQSSAGAISTQMPGAPVSVPRGRSRRRVIYGIVALTLVAAGLLALRFRAPRQDALAAAVQQPSIAILPLANLSPDARDAFLADGMTEELIAKLAKTGGLRVIASTSVFAFRDRRLDVRRIADSLHVGQVLEGDVEKSGSRLRVQVRLIDGHDGGTRWSDTYNRELRDVFAVQDDIASAVARELGLRLGGLTGARVNRHQTRNIAAYELYLRGSDPALLRSDSGVQMALAYFQQAVALDSTYAAAYAGLSRMYGRLGYNASVGGSRRNRLILAEQSAAKALALDDSLADAHAALALVESGRFDLSSAESQLEQAADLEPARATFHEWLVQLYTIAGRPAQALTEAQRALDLDPLSPSANAELARALLANGRADDALAQLQKVASLRPPLLRADIIAAQSYMKKSMWPQAIAVLRTQAERGGPTALAHLGYALGRTGQREAALRIRAMLVDRWRNDTGGALEVALVSAGLGDLDQAFAWLDRGIAGGSMRAEGTELLLEDLHRDPRFERVRERMGLHKP